MNIEWGFSGIAGLTNIHPIFVHFPIALLLFSFAMFAMGIVLNKEQLLVTSKWSLYLGTLAAAITVWTGLQAEATVGHGSGSHEIMITHKYMGFMILGLSVLLSVWSLLSKSLIPKAKIGFLSLFAIMSLLIAQSADLGGRMVFLHGVGVGQKSMSSEESGHDHGSQEHGGQEPVREEQGGHDHGAHAH